MTDRQTRPLTGVKCRATIVYVAENKEGIIKKTNIAKLIHLRTVEIVGLFSPVLFSLSNFAIIGQLCSLPAHWPCGLETANATHGNIKKSKKQPSESSPDFGKMSWFFSFLGWGKGVYSCRYWYFLTRISPWKINLFTWNVRCETFGLICALWVL